MVWPLRDGGHFTPVVNCQRHFNLKMADKNYGSQGKRVPCDILNNLSFVDLFSGEESNNNKSSKNNLGIYQGERLIARRQDADVRKTLLH